MDPYDDYDPKQYVYDESSQEDDVVYLEGPVLGDDPFLPYLAKDMEFSQSQSQSTEQQMAPNLLPRRERKRRRTEAAAQMLGGSSDSESSDSPDNNEEQDTFASLQSFLENQSKQRKGSQNSNSRTGGENESGGHQKGYTVPTETNLAARADSAVQNENDVPADRAIDSYTQPEFPIANDWDLSQAEPTERSIDPVVSASQQAISGSSVSLGLEKELQRQRKRKQAASQSQMTSVDNLRSRTYDANLSRRTARQGPDWSKKRTIGGEMSSGQSLFHSVGSQAPVANSASIVGSRPQHWGASRTPALLMSQGWKRAVSPRSSHLAAAAQRKTRPNSTLTQPIRSSFLSTTTRKQSGRSPAHSSKISFAPSFVHFTKSIEQEDSVEELQESSIGRSERGAVIQGYQTPRILQRFNLNANAADSAGSCNGSTPNSGNQRRKRNASMKLKAGPLMKRLRAIRSAVDGDRVRFQSGMYPFAQSASRRFDMSDPRNRATSYMDVSIVGEPVPWDENERVTVLGCIHANEKLPSSDSDAGLVGTQLSAGFAWLSFTYETAREQKLWQGSRLRIYNPISVPTKAPIQVDGLGEGHVVKDRTCNQTVICTQLCESYPDSLPTLPSMT